MSKPLFIAKQSGHPQGWFGHIVASVMARETTKANRFAMECPGVRDGDAVLEVGFGHGKTVREIARCAPAARISGVDPSKVMVSVAHRKCHAYADRLDLRMGFVESLPFEDSMFDRALTVHTTYFWPKLEPGLREIRRVLSDQGRFVLGFRPADDRLAAESLHSSVYTLHTIDEMKAALSLAGFNNLSIERTELKKGFLAWAICN